MENILSILGSLASLITLIFAIGERNTTKKVRVLVVVVVILSLSTSYLLYKNSEYESGSRRYVSVLFSQNLKKIQVEREASSLLSRMPSHVNKYEPGENEGIVYSVLRFLESRKNQTPELYKQFKENILSDVEAAKGLRGTEQHREIIEDAAKASLLLLSSMAGDN